ncbi:MAG: cytochrome c [Silvibacterium sp.]
MKKVWAAAVFGAILFVAALVPCQAATNGSGEDAGVRAGAKVFSDQCAVCHSVEPNKKIVGPSLYGEVSGTKPRKIDAQLRDIVLKGIGRMPDFKDELSSQDLDNLLAYLHTVGDVTGK